MIPTITCIENACVAGVVWRPDLMAAFLAWWMPLNLLSWLAVLILVPLMNGRRWKEEVFTLRRTLLMTLFFWPDFIGRVGYVLIDHWRKSRNRKKRMSNQEAYFRNKHFTEDF